MMNRQLKTVLTAMFVVVLTAIYVVGLFLLWDVFGVEDKLDDLMNTDIYGGDYAPESSTAVDISFGGKNITEEEKLLLGEFFRYYYAGLGAKKTEKISRFYTVQCNFELFDELAYAYEVYLLGKCPLDLSFDSCKITIDIKRRHDVTKKNSVEIDAEIYSETSGSAVGRPTVTRGEKHSFVLNEKGKLPLIDEHTTSRPSRVTADDGLDRVLAASGYVRSDMNYTFFPKYTKAALEMLSKEADELALAPADISAYPAAEYPYDRNAAANAAVAGFSGDGIFSVYDENDANFVSRCIFVGGIPMDSQGEKYDQWKWYDEEVNTDRKKTGCSVTWFDRDAFCKYVLTNTGFGLAGCETGSGGGELGDVVQLMENGKAVSEFMITGIMTAQDGTVADYLLSNDAYSSVSLRSLGFREIRVLHIVGYNTANI